MHFTISRCNSVRILGVKVSSPGDSPNTDGIHISESTNVLVQDCKIGTGSQLESTFLCLKCALAIMRFKEKDTCLVSR